MKNFLSVTILFILSFMLFFSQLTVFASPENALLEAKLAQELLIKIQNNKENDSELEKLYMYLDVIYHENTQFYSYKIDELEKLMDHYRENIIKTARSMAQSEQYRDAVEFLQSKSEIFKDKSVINNLITHYSKFFIKEGLFYCETAPKILSVNKLIAYPSVMYENEQSANLVESEHLTNKEFSSLLNELYKNDYCLININEYIEIDDNSVLKKDIYLPKDKKPVILVFNNLNYNSEPYFIEKYIIDSKDAIACYSSKQSEKNQVSYNTDLIGILEAFVEENKDFSINGAKALLSFNKNNAILGYNISKTNPNQSQEISNLKKLVALLKEKNYNFCYENAEINNYDTEDFEKENIYIQETLKNIFGNINYFSFQNAQFKYGNYAKLKNLGFKVFITISNKVTSIFKNDYIMLGTLHIKTNEITNLTQLGLSPENIFDYVNRKKVLR